MKLQNNFWLMMFCAFDFGSGISFVCLGLSKLTGSNVILESPYLCLFAGILLLINGGIVTLITTPKLE